MRAPIFALAALLAGCASVPTYTTLSPADMAARVDVGEDQIERFRYASSKPVFENVFEDNGSWVWIVEKEGVTRVSVYMRTQEADWVHPKQGYIGLPSHDVPVDAINGDVQCAGRSCLHIETTRLDLSDVTVRALLSEAQGEAIPLRLVGSTGFRVNGVIRKAELAATLDRFGILNRYR